MVIWLTGLSGSGKTSLAKALYRLMKPSLPELVVLDGDKVRSAMGGDLGYEEKDRITQVKRLQNMAKLLVDQGLIVIVAVVYANPELLEWNRSNFEEYFEIHLNSSLETVIKRDSKGLYRKALSGETTDVVGVDIPWNPPVSPDLVINANDPEPSDELAHRVIRAIPGLSPLLEGT